MRLYLFAILFAINVLSLGAQNVIGLSTKDVKSSFKSNYPELVLDSNVNNDHYRYLKYTDLHSNLITVLVFLNEFDRCKAVRSIYDLSLEKQVLDELNTKYERQDSTNWIDSRQGKRVRISFTKEKWFITVNYKEE